ncbi:hypothetical protein [Paenibacillus sp. OV219]|uniref:hypothetical protein n=1 Tax=Paenibacillus sp. OV219 TaxID=1884377 RepID=UPI0008AB2425|nr:hypothetical protein [Paenibacillus sp. OV219]SEO42084.1 hypothetical protein SAMN05518847_107357 [Paenibacillus sp. OV219]
MVSPWVTGAVILLGIIVAVAGVIAYLRMYKNSAWSAMTSRSPESDPQRTIILGPKQREESATSEAEEEPERDEN